MLVNIIYFKADSDKCIEVLVNTGKVAEAALFARSYYPSKVKELTGLWKKSLLK